MAGVDIPSLTNRAFGDAIGVSQSMASRIRCGRRRPSVTTLLRMSAAFDISLEDLVQAYNEGTLAALLAEEDGQISA